MKRTTLAAALVIAAVVAVSVGIAQPPGPPRERGDEMPRGPGNPGPGFGPPPSPILEAIDTDGDHELSSDEIAAAAQTLKKLDENGDDRLSHHELRPKFGPPNGEDRASGPNHRRPGPDDRRPGPDGPPSDFETRRPDGRPSGFQNRRSDGPPPRFEDRRPEGRPPGFEGRRPDGPPPEFEGRRPDGPPPGLQNRSAEGPPHAFENRGPAGRRPQEPGPGPEGRSRTAGGPPSAEAFVEHAFRFDENSDGMLSRDELLKMGQSLGPRLGGPNGPPREHEGRFEGRDGRPVDLGAREAPSRPQRPPLEE